MGYLVLVRHGESEYNAKGLWTGWDNPSLTEKGHTQAKEMGKLLSNIHFDCAFSSSLSRAKQTIDDILSVLHQTNTVVTESEKLNERNYGIYTGKNKWQIKEKVGDDKFLLIRRSWNYQIPEGESLKQVYERVIPYYQATIEPILKEGKNVIITSSGNAIRAVVKHIENISNIDISKQEMPIGGAVIYKLDLNGNVIEKEMRGGEIDQPH